MKRISGRLGAIRVEPSVASARPDRRTAMPVTIAAAGLLLAAFLASPARAQEKSADGLWTPLNLEAAAAAVASVAEGRVPSNKYKLFELDPDRLKQRLQEATPAQSVTRASGADAPSAEITIPRPDGTYQTFAIFEAPLFAPELAAKFPNLKIYNGRSLNGSPATIACEISPDGFSAQIRSGTQTIIIMRAQTLEPAAVYASFDKVDYQSRRDKKRCLVPGNDLLPPARQRPQKSLRSDGGLRTYRLAVAATGEYTKFHGGTIAKALAAIVTTVNRVNQIYEAELSIRFKIVANMDRLIYTDAENDPFDNDNANVLIEQSQQVIDKTIGEPNYDVGHTLSTGAGGLALLASVAQPGIKAQGVTGSESPRGDPFDVDYVAHELGHQFGADHTYNGISASCGANRNAGTAFEPGGGTTILGYAGICGADDVQRSSNAYFHFASLDQILLNVTSGKGHPPGHPTGNRPPEVKADHSKTGEAFFVPRGTPFILAAQGTDSDGDSLTYVWEEEDLGLAAALGTPDNASSPLFRSVINETGIAPRILPRLENALKGAWSSDEIMPEKERNLHFRVTARDNRFGGGAVAGDTVGVSIVTAAGPFRVTEPRTMPANSRDVVVRWEVANTDKAPINARFVDILFSHDGGKTFPQRLAAGTPNDGSERVSIPENTSGSPRIKVEAVDNIFFSIAPFDAPSSIAPPEAGSIALPAATGTLPAQEPNMAARARHLDGAWLLADGEGLLKIEGSEWRHPDKGLATLSEGGEAAADYEVTYQQHQGIKCGYRVMKAADRRILMLEATDATQPPDYCPSGKLLKAD